MLGSSSAGHADHVLAIGSQFLPLARKAASEAELTALMEDVTREIGFRRFAAIHHEDLRVSRPGLINLNNYPDGWAEAFIHERLYRVDPAVHACLRTSTPFWWRDIAQWIALDAAHSATLERAARAGLHAGITVPCCIPGEPTGSCSFGCPRPGTDPVRAMMLAQWVGSFAFEAARRIARGGQFVLPGGPRLTPRQRECLLLVGQGKSDWAIGQLLGLSGKTVKHYLDDARLRFDVATRAQLLICALLAGEINLIELMPRQ